MSVKIETYLNQLSVGFVENSNKVYKPYRALFKMGKVVIDVIEQKIFSQSWVKVDHISQVTVLVGMLNLVNDLDEPRCREIVNKIIELGCEDEVRRKLLLVIQFSVSDFYIFDFRGLKVFVSKKLKRLNYIEAKMKKWLSVVPEDDLSGMERMYVVPPISDDYRGLYMPILCYSEVHWDCPSIPFNPFAWVYLYSIEKTTFHEIGHHLHRHTFGHDPEQEKEANIYAFKMLSKSHYILFEILKWLAFTYKK